MKKYNFTTIITQEDKFYIARCVELGVVSQGLSVDEATKNLKEAVELYLEDASERYLNRATQYKPLISTLELEYTSIIGSTSQKELE